MTHSKFSQDGLAEITEKVLQMPKYAGLDLLPETICDLVRQESLRFKNIRQVEKAVREKLHNVVAPYLGNVNYSITEKELIEAFEQGETTIKAACLKILNSHVSTAERSNNLENFYQTIFTRTGNPDSILDLACGYHPFAIPWMNLGAGCAYYAFDIIKPRINLINTFLELSGMQKLAFQKDILLAQALPSADVAFFFKEAHRFEQRQRGCNRHFWHSLNVSHLLVSLPVTGMKSQHDLSDQHRRLVYENISGFNWIVEEFEIGNELFFWIQK